MTKKKLEIKTVEDEIKPTLPFPLTPQEGDSKIDKEFTGKRVAKAHSTKNSQSKNLDFLGANVPDPQRIQLPNHEPAKCSVKRNGIVKGYSANTNQGIVRNYNEDRVSIILNMMKPSNKQHLDHWPKVSFFAIYDGHGGQNCADFL